MTHSRYWALAPLVLLGACGTSIDPDTSIEAVRATETASLESIASKDLGGVTRHYDEKAVLVFPNSAPAEGTEAISRAFEAMLADPNLSVKLTPGPAWAASSGDLAVTTATINLTSTQPGAAAPTTVNLANQTTWHRAEGSTWKIVADYNAALPGPPPS